MCEQSIRHRKCNCLLSAIYSAGVLYQNTCRVCKIYSGSLSSDNVFTQNIFFTNHKPCQMTAVHHYSCLHFW